MDIEIAGRMLTTLPSDDDHPYRTGPRLPHDMIHTENYAIPNDFPMYWEPELISKGVFVAGFHLELPSRFGVLPRRGESHEIRWFETDPTYVLHFTNAWEDVDEIVVEGFFQHDPMPHVPPGASFYERMHRFISLDGFQSRLHRWLLNMRTGRATEEQLTDTISEFGMINAHYATRPNRYVVGALGEPGRFLFNGLIRHDTATGAEDRYELPPGVFASETAVPPRVGSTDEDDAYLVTLTIDLANDVSECLVFDAARLSDGPVARLRLPERISSGTHATWAPGSAIPGWNERDEAQDDVRL